MMQISRQTVGSTFALDIRGRLRKRNLKHVKPFRVIFSHRLVAYPLTTHAYDHGFADRVIALTVRNSLIEDGYEQEFFKPSLQTHEELLTQILEKFPTYFESVLKSLI